MRRVFISLDCEKHSISSHNLLTADELHSFLSQSKLPTLSQTTSATYEKKNEKKQAALYWKSSDLWVHWLAWYSYTHEH